MNTPLLTLLPFFFTFLLWQEVATSTSRLQRKKPNCTSKCGDIPVPYPFGFLGDDEACYYNLDFQVFCNHSFKPPKLIMGTNMEIINLSFEGQMTALSTVSFDCYDKLGNSTGWNWVSLRSTNDSLYTVSDTQNKFTALGCDTKATITGYNGRSFKSGCNMFCVNKTDVINGSCSGIGCCQTSVPKGFASFNLSIDYYQSSHTRVWDFNPCSYGFIVQDDWFKFSTSYLSKFTSEYMIEDKAAVPFVYDWAIELKSCEEAVKNQTTYACVGNLSECVVSKNGIGYSCVCLKGYQGNPYLEDGCQDVDECKAENLHNCSENANCKNRIGGYSCHCPLGYRGDGWKSGTSHYGALRKGSGCRNSNIILIIAGVSVCTIALPSIILFIYWAIKKRRLLKLFKQNGGMLLQQQIASYKRDKDIAKIFTIKELKKATKNFNRNQILGEGGFGTDIQGNLTGEKIVAIKKSKIMDQTQIIQFINEVDILSQINHRHVVKLLGCCLETEVPLLVYEFISNGTLYQLIHSEKKALATFSWENRLRIAAETADALAYLHSSHSVPIFHRDVKSSNILLDDKYRAKVSDFGASRLVPLDQTQKTTAIQGTYGYLDPECWSTGQLTDKSDVYSFGVVVAELLTGKKPIFMDGSGEWIVLARFFTSSVKNGNLFHILDDRIKEDDANSQQFLIVANIARNCLEDRRGDRPTMKEVAKELDSLKMIYEQPTSQHIVEETDISVGGQSKSSIDPTLEMDIVEETDISVGGQSKSSFDPTLEMDWK